WPQNPETRQLTAGLWDAATGALIAPLVDTVTVRSIQFSPSGDRIVAGREDGLAQLWDTASGRLLLTIATAPPGQENACSNVGDNPHSSCFAALNEVRFIDAGRQVETRGKALNRWDAQSGKAIPPPAVAPTDNAENPPGLRRLATSPDGSKLVTIHYEHP